MPTATEVTEDYIQERRSIKECLKKGLINYSALARLIAGESRIEKKTSKEAILIAARRYKEKIDKTSSEEKIINLFKDSNIEIKNNIVRYVIDKTIYPDSLIEIEKGIKKERSLFFAMEGSKTISILIQKQHRGLLDKKFKQVVIDKKENLSLITITSPGIEYISGAVAYLSGLIAENGINMHEFMSFYDDTFIVINPKDLEKMMKCLNF